MINQRRVSKRDYVRFIERDVTERPEVLTIQNRMTKYRRSLPNVLVAGTPGVGKTELCQYILDHVNVPLVYLPIGKLVKEQGWYDEHDDTLDACIMDDDKLLDGIETTMRKGGALVDFHGVEVFPRKWLDIVLVLRSDTAVLYDRLQAREYSKAKINENIECEIMQVILEEAHAKTKHIYERKNNNRTEMKNNGDFIISLIEQVAIHNK